MLTAKRIKCTVCSLSLGVALLGLLAGFTSCSSSSRPTPRAETNLDPGWPRGNNFFHQTSYGKLHARIPEVPNAEIVDMDEFCETCHPVHSETFAENVHGGTSCESCHGPASTHLETRGEEAGTILSFRTPRVGSNTGILMSPAERSEVCLQCHDNCGTDQEDPGPAVATWRNSAHSHNQVACTDCHTSHYNVPPGTPVVVDPDGAALGPKGHPNVLASYQDSSAEPSPHGTSNHLGASSPGVCYGCHEDMREFQQIAGPHQICGPNGFNCTTCHDPHGNILEKSRKDLCLECHESGSPTMAFHSSVHDMEGVACTDCHNPHPRPDVPRVVGISHTSVRRPKRTMMSVDEPETCYKCHTKIHGQNALPSHHPIKEGKMTCSDCHDSHGQFERNLKADSINDLCYKCHAEKQGPFVYEHPPASEDCVFCHNPHGTVTNNLLRQPATFLCLRCHSGHRRTVHPGGLQENIDGNPALRPPLYTDCTNCHSQIHGSDLPSQHRQQSLMR